MVCQLCGVKSSCQGLRGGANLIILYACMGIMLVVKSFTECHDCDNNIVVL